MSELVVARLGRPHGIAGEVWLDVRSDRPAQRLKAGARFGTDRPGLPQLTVARVRHSQKGWCALFEELPDRTAVEGQRGAALLIDTDQARDQDPEHDAWYEGELEGLAAVLPDGTPAGVIAGFEEGAVQDLLKVREPDGEIVLVPFVRALVPEVDVAAGRVVLDPPGGLLKARPATGAPDAVDDEAVPE